MAKQKPAAINLEEDAVKPQPTNEKLKGISGLCERMVKLQAEHAALMVAAEAVQNKINYLSETEIPAAMKEVGMDSFKLTDGRTVEVKEEDYGSYAKYNESEVFKWLKVKGHGDMIKSAAVVEFGKGNEALVDKLQKVLLQKAYKGCVVAFKETVHASTFKAFVREQLAEGKPLPKQIAIFHKSETIIKESKNGKSTNSKNSTKGTANKGASEQDLF
jgi:hypothetical protein